MPHKQWESKFNSYPEDTHTVREEFTFQQQALLPSMAQPQNGAYTPD